MHTYLSHICKNQMVKWMIAFLLLLSTQSIFYYPVTHIFIKHFFILCLNFMEQFRVWYLAQEYFNMQTGGAGDQTTDLLTGRPPTLPAEVQSSTPHFIVLLHFSLEMWCWRERAVVMSLYTTRVFSGGVPLKATWRMTTC